ncbi:hypothetical protein V501_06579 [Pseudogymnoascus sp. VKM F-4519 (FW-2642)]|nr:hypothetical protein V501_06579 [Pseudogymnoascus sp. VKM F-4519 (FW-2642)]
MRSSKSASAKAPPPLLTGAAKLAEVKRLLEKLSLDLQKICMLPHREQDVEVDVDSTRLTDIERDAALEQLKLYGRDPVDAEPIFTQEGIETLTRHAFNSPSFTTSRNALRCLANALLLRASSRAVFVDLHYEMKLCQRLSNDNREDEFLVSRIIFLTTYGGNMDLENLIDNHHLADNINQNISRHAKQYDEVQKIEKKESDRSSASSMSTKDKEKREKKERKAKEKEMKKNAKNPESTEPDPMEDMSLAETLKLLFNTTHFCRERASAFVPAIPSIMRLLLKRAVAPTNPMEPPTAQLISALINLPLDLAESHLFPRSDPKIHVERLVNLLDLATAAYPERDLEQQVSPLLSLLRKIYAVAPRPVKVHLRMLLLPTAEDRLKPLGATNTLSSRILKLSTSPLAPTAREELSHLLFEMSDKDAKNFVQNVGYGFASGFLFQNNVPIPENALDAWSINDSASMGGRSSVGERSSSSSARTFGMVGGKAVNPITGQTLDSEEPWEGPKMTREEKEREAERLMVMFDRLQKNGIIKTENPMRTMQHEGRFEELSDDDSS